MHAEFQIAVLMACHNRRDSTLTCLQRLHGQTLPQGCRLALFLVDDGSTDGTGDAVRECWPGARVINGDGTLYWNQGMRRAWEQAAPGDYDAYLWLNDDTFLGDDALRTLIDTLHAQMEKVGRAGIVVGTCRDPDSGRRTFGGWTTDGEIEPGPVSQPAECFNGNVVLVSRAAFETVGNLEPAYRHMFGDADYGLRATRAGVPVWVAPGYQAECRPTPLPVWRSPLVSLGERWKAYHGPKGISRRELRHFLNLDGRRFWVLSLMKQYLMLLVPWMFGQRKKARESEE